MPPLTPRAEEDEYAVDPMLWSTIEPAARELARPEIRLIRRTAVALSTIVLLGAGAWWAGLLGPRLQMGDRGGGNATEGSLVWHEELAVENATLVPAHVIAVESLVPGVSVTAARTTPDTIPGGATGVLDLDWRVDECLAGTDVEGTEVLVTTRTWWGSSTQVLDLSLSTVRPWTESVCPR